MLWGFDTTKTCENNIFSLFVTILKLKVVRNSAFAMCNIGCSNRFKWKNLNLNCLLRFNQCAFALSYSPIFFSCIVIHLGKGYNHSLFPSLSFRISCIYTCSMLKFNSLILFRTARGTFLLIMKCIMNVISTIIFSQWV